MKRNRKPTRRTVEFVRFHETCGTRDVAPPTMEIDATFEVTLEGDTPLAGRVKGIVFETEGEEL